MNTGFGIASKNVGRFIFNMFALGSVLALVARAGRSVMESDESYRASTELTANALGQILAPAMKTIVNLTQYAVIGIAELVRLFTGYNALAKVTTKNIQNASKATKELNKQIYSFDEITKAGNEKALNLGLEADLKALDDFQSKVKDVRNWLEENKDWLEKVGVTLLTVFGGVKLSQVLGGVSSLVGTAGTGMAVGTGLAGLAGLLVYLASIAVITIAIYGANEVNSILDSITNQSRGLTEQTKQMTEEYRKLYEQGKLTDNQYKTYVNSIKGLIDSNNEEIKSAREKQTWWGELTGANKRYVDQINEAKKRNDLLNQSMKELTGKPYTVQLKTEVETTRFKNFFANVKIYASSLGNAVLGALGLGGLANIKIPTFAGGNVATAPTFGMFGEYADARANPEITIPQNIMYDTVSKALSNNMGNSNVIDKLDELIGVMEQQRIINFNVNGRTVDREMQRVNSDSNFSYNG
jgi:uncharacterized protein YoxC